MNQWQEVHSSMMDSSPLLARVRSLLEHGARGLHEPGNSPQPGKYPPAASPTPVGIAIQKRSIHVLRLFDEFGFDWRTVTLTWQPVSAEQKEIYQFLIERGAQFEAPQEPLEAKLTPMTGWTTVTRH
jgi:hypothetical protein